MFIAILLPGEDMEMLETGDGEELEAGFQGVYAKLKAGGLC